VPLFVELLDLSSNKLSGPVPIHIGLSSEIAGAQPAAIRGLYLSDNNFNGTISDSICALTNLQALVVAANPQLSGPVPDCASFMLDP
jgi:hypothetical protein